jgi:hypothetical protein
MVAAEADDVPHVAVLDVPLSGVEVLGLEDELSVIAVSSARAGFWIRPEHTSAIANYRNRAEEGLNSVFALSRGAFRSQSERRFSLEPRAFHELFIFIIEEWENPATWE